MAHYSFSRLTLAVEQRATGITPHVLPDAQCGPLPHCLVRRGSLCHAAEEYVPCTYHTYHWCPYLEPRGDRSLEHVGIGDTVRRPERNGKRDDLLVGAG